MGNKATRTNSGRTLTSNNQQQCVFFNIPTELLYYVLSKIDKDTICELRGTCQLMKYYIQVFGYVTFESKLTPKDFLKRQ